MNTLLTSSRWLLARPTAFAAQPIRLAAQLYSTTPSPTPEASTSSSPNSSTAAPPTSTPTPARSSALDSVVLDLQSSQSTSPSLTSSSSSDSSTPAFFRHKTPPTPRPTSSPSYASASSPTARHWNAPPTHDSAYRSMFPVGFPAPVTPTSARSFDVKNNDLGRAYRLLNRTLMENNVRRELRQQERFESGSDRRVRLNSERHRRRFKVAVGKAVGLAMRMKDL